MAEAQMKKAARPARFNGASQRRRALLAKVHVAKKELGLADDDYRQIVSEETRQMSAGDCTEAQLETVIRRFQGRGWKAKPARRAKPAQGKRARPQAQHPMARKARALWISLYQLGAVRYPSEKALEAFAKRQLKCEALVWAKQSHSAPLIEALKAMAERHGWAQTDDAGRNLSVLALKRGLCQAILAKLIECGEVPNHWSIYDAGFKLCGIDSKSTDFSGHEGYVTLAGALGEKLRAAQGGAA